MRLATLLLLCLLAALPIAHAQPAAPVAVRVGKAEWTTEPAPREPILRPLPARPSRLRVRVITDAALCGPGWSASAADRRVTLTPPSPPDVVAAAGTCATTLDLGPLGRGAWSLALGGKTVRVRVR